MTLKEIFTKYRERLARQRRAAPRPEGPGRLGRAGPVITPGGGPAGTPAGRKARTIKPQPTSNPFPGVNVK